MEDDILVQAANEGDCVSFCKGTFREANCPLLPRPARSPKLGGRSRKRVMVATTTRVSQRQAARPSPVLVSQRAQQKLMRELKFMDSPTLPLDVAVM